MRVSINLTITNHSYNRHFVIDKYSNISIYLYGLLDVDIIHARNCTQDTIVQSLVLKPFGLPGEKQRAFPRSDRS